MQRDHCFAEVMRPSVAAKVVRERVYGSEQGPSAKSVLILVGDHHLTRWLVGRTAGSAEAVAALARARLPPRCLPRGWFVILLHKAPPAAQVVLRPPP